MARRLKRLRRRRRSRKRVQVRNTGWHFIYSFGDNNAAIVCSIFSRRHRGKCRCPSFRSLSLSFVGRTISVLRGLWLSSSPLKQRNVLFLMDNQSVIGFQITSRHRAHLSIHRPTHRQPFWNWPWKGADDFLGLRHWVFIISLFLIVCWIGFVPVALGAGK